MVIRPYESKDFEGIVDVIKATQMIDCWSKVYPEGWNEERIKFEFDPIKNYHNPLFLVSEQEGKIAGLIAGHGLGDFITYETKHLSDEFNRQIKLGEIPFYQRDILLPPTINLEAESTVLPRTNGVIKMTFTKVSLLLSFYT